MNSNWLLVELVPDLAAAQTTRTGVFAQIKQVTGVTCVVDVTSITRETFDEWLQPDELDLGQKPKKARGRKAS